MASYFIFQTKSYILLLIRWAQRNSTWGYPMIWAMLTSMIPSNPSLVCMQDLLSKIVKNTSVIPSAINFSAPLLNKQKDVYI